MDISGGEDQTRLQQRHPLGSRRRYYISVASEMCQSRQPWASEETTSGLAQLKYLNEACNGGSLMLGTYYTALHCTVLYSTVEVKVGNHRIPSANYLTVIGMISVPSKTPCPIPTPFQKIPFSLERKLRLSTRSQRERAEGVSGAAIRQFQL